VYELWLHAAGQCGDKRNITRQELNQAAQAANITPEQTAANIMTSCRQEQAQQPGMSESQTPPA
jgi:hypothetical protein